MSPRGVLALHVDQQGGDIGRVHPADPPGLAEGAGADPEELFAGLRAELRDRRVIQVGRDRLLFEAAEPLDLERCRSM